MAKPKDWDDNPDGVRPGQAASVRMNPHTGEWEPPEEECMHCGGSGIDPESLGTCPLCHGDYSTAAKDAAS